MIKKDTTRNQKKSKVVAIDQAAEAGAPRLIASDAQTQRYVFAIGQQRIAYDVTTQITRLAPATGDQPAPVLPLAVVKTDAKPTAQGNGKARPK